MKQQIYEMAKDFKNKYPSTIAWRLKSHAKIASEILNNDERIDYVFVAQKNDKFYDLLSTTLVILTDQRILFCQKRVFFGYFTTSIQKYMFNDLKIKRGIIWGKIHIDTVKEFVCLSNISKNALIEIENKIYDHVTEK